MIPEDPIKTTEEVQFPYRIAERYHCKEYLGGGGSGLVFKAWDDMLQRMVAIKFIRNPSLITRQRLVAEARALAKVNHPSICSIYDIGEPVDEHSSLFMVMELIEGPRLTELAGQLTTASAIKIIHKLAEGLSELHAAGLVHNDINPGNVIIKQQDSDEPFPTLIDMSIAGRHSHPVRSRGFGVTPLFAAPEQHEGNVIHPQQRELVDIYSIGALLFFLITGQAPQKHPDKILREYRDRCNSPLRSIILNCIAHEPTRRYKSANQLVQELGPLRYPRRPWLPIASVIAGSGLALAAVVGVVQNIEFGATADNKETALLQDELLSQATAYALYAEQLRSDNKHNEARKQAQKTVQYYRRAIAVSETNNIKPVMRLVDFLLNFQQLFSVSELSALLLDTLTQLETKDKLHSNDHLLSFTQARIYFNLAKLHRDQEHLSERWAKRALSEVKRAVNKQPALERYTQLQCRIEKYLGQSSTGTC